MSLNLYKCLLEMQLGYASYELFIYCANSRPHQPAFLLFVLSYFSFAKFELFLISVLLLILSPHRHTASRQCLRRVFICQKALFYRIFYRVSFFSIGYSYFWLFVYLVLCFAGFELNAISYFWFSYLLFGWCLT